MASTGQTRRNQALALALFISLPLQGLSMSPASTRAARDKKSSAIVVSRTRSSSSFLAASSTRSSFLVGSLLAGAAMSQIQPEVCQAMPGMEPSVPRYVDQEVALPGSRSKKVLVRRITGDSTPYAFPAPRPIPLTKVWPESPPFASSDFARDDDRDDAQFYSQPRLVYHIDEPAVAALTQYYRRTIRPGSSVLDICSSWVSHYPREFASTAMDRICATGISEAELSLNDQVSDNCFKASNLNVDPVLPFPDASFDVVTCVVSIDYLIHPIEVLKEVARVLKPGGQLIVSQSNRCFPTKAINLWLHMSDREHLELIRGFLQYAGGFERVEAFDITARVPDQARHDPMFVVRAVAKS
jgi:Methyltransferase domain